MLMDVSLPHTLGLEEGRESSPWPIFSRQVGAMLQFDAAIAGLQCHGEGLTARSCPCPTSWHKPWLPPLSNSNNLKSSAFPIMPQAHSLYFGCSPPKNIATLYLDSLSFYILILFPFIHCFAGSHPWLVTLYSWEGLLTPFIISLVWDLWNLLVSHQLLETWGSLKMKGWRMKYLSGVRMALDAEIRISF